MSTPPTPQVDPTALAEMIAYLSNIHDRSPEKYAEAMADNIVRPDPLESAAFRSPQLINASVAAARYLLNNANRVLEREPTPGEDRVVVERKRQATRRFRDRVGQENTLLRRVADGLLAQQGFEPTKPNARRRAEQRLVQLNLAGDVPKGKFRELLEEEQAKDKAAAAQRKKDARAAARARRGGGTTPPRGGELQRPRSA